MEAISFPRSILVETTLRCPADCIICPNKKVVDRPRDMPWRLFRKVVDDCRGQGLEEFHPFINGEPLASPYLEAALAYLAVALPETAVHIYTSGALLDERMAGVLLRSGVRAVHFSVDGATRQTYEAHRRGLHFDEVLANINTFLGLVRYQHAGVSTRVVMTLTPENAAEEAAFRRYWEGRVDVVEVLPSDGRGGEGRAPAFRDGRMMGCLHVPWRTYVLSDGRVVLCCKDWAGYTVLGNVAEASVAEIWNSPRYVQLRREISRGDFSHSEVCQRCQADAL